MLGAAIAAGSMAGLGGGFSYLGAKEQSDASIEAMKMQMKEASKARTYANEMANNANYVYNKYTPMAQGVVTDYTEAARGQLQGGLGDYMTMQGQGMGQLGDMYGQSFGTLNAAQDQAMRSYYGGQQGFEGALGQGIQQGAGALGQGMGGVYGLQNMIGSGNMYSGFEQDPGYAFRQQQGEQAINRAASAAGGRVSGRTLQELGNFNQGLASQEFQNFANRRGQEVATMQNLAGMQQQGGRDLSGLLYGGNAAIGSQRAQTAGDMARMQAAFGSQMAGAQQGLGGQLAGMYGNMGQTAMGVAGQQANLETGLGSQLANLYMQQAQGRGNAYLGAASTNAGISQNLINQMQIPTQYAGQQWGAMGNALNNFGQGMLTYGMMGGFDGGGAVPQTYRI